MSIQRFDPEDIEVFSVETAPRTVFVSGAWGTSGSAYLYPRRSTSIKEHNVNWTVAEGTPTGAFAQINNLDDVLQRARLSTSTTDKTAYIREYLNRVGSQPQNIRNSQKKAIERITPGVNLSTDMTKKFVVTNTLMPYYSSFGSNYDFAFTNYNTFNFFTSSAGPTGSALLYPMSSSAAAAGSVVTASYVPSGAFTFDFWINPKYTTDSPGGHFKAGTLFHVSGAYAISLITGSSRDTNGYADKFRLLLQLSSSANTKPSEVNPSALTGSCFVSDDNALNKNTWHHVTVRWGTNTYNFGSGSFLVDGVEAGVFYIPSSSVAPRYEAGVANPDMLCVGNYYEGPNSGSSMTAYFFSDAAQTRYGIPVTGSAYISSTTQDEPSSYTFAHPLNAEVHELKLYNRFLSDGEVLSRSLTGTTPTDPGLLFYVPPLFTRESPSRSVDVNGGVGGVLVHPFKAVTGTTTHPFNVDLSFDTGGHYINLENYSRDFVNGNYPRLILLTGSAINGNTRQLTANGFLYASGSNRKASLTVLPCDNGQFMPSYYELLRTLNTSSFVTDKGNPALNLITLRNMYSLDSIYDLVPPVSGADTLNTEGSGSKRIIAALSGFDSTSSFGTLNPQRTPTILQRTQENSSLQTVLFDVSSLFYGNRIKPGTVSITDNNVSNSAGKVGITLRDDGNGSLYRADSTGSHSTWNSVGNVFYDNGVILLKNPSLYFFGETGFSCSFQGERNIHVLKLDMYANPLDLVSSSNPDWSSALSSSLSTDTFDERYVYITDLYVHDENLNVIMKSKLSQPVLKRTGDKLKFTTKLDY